MLDSFKERYGEHNYGINSSKPTESTQIATITTKPIKNNQRCLQNLKYNNKINNINNYKNCQTIDINKLIRSGSIQHVETRNDVHTTKVANKLQRLNSEPGGLTVRGLRTYEPHDRHTNMHSSAVAKDSTAVIVNIGGCDQSADNYGKSYYNNNQQIRTASGKVRRTSSCASYSEVGSAAANRRERKISSSSQSNKFNNQHRSASPKSSPKPTRQTSRLSQSIRSQQPIESLPKTSNKRQQTTPTTTAEASRSKLRQRSIDAAENVSINKQFRHRGDSLCSSPTASSCNGSCSSDEGDTNTTSTSSGEPNLPYPGFPEVALKYLTQDTRPRNWCLMMITNPYPF